MLLVTFFCTREKFVIFIKNPPEKEMESYNKKYTLKNLNSLGWIKKSGKPEVLPSALTLRQISMYRLLRIFIDVWKLNLRFRLLGEVRSFKKSILRNFELFPKSELKFSIFLFSTNFTKQKIKKKQLSKHTTAIVTQPWCAHRELDFTEFF